MDNGEIGRPGYNNDRATEATARANRRRQRRDRWQLGVLGWPRVRAVVAVVLAALAWLWLLGWVGAPRWTTFLAAGAAVKSARRASEPGASDLTYLLVLVARAASGVFLLWAVPAAVVEMQHNGVVALLNYLLASPA